MVLGLGCLVWVFGIATGHAQAQPDVVGTATVIVSAPIYLNADVTLAPLRTAAVNTVLRVLEQRGDWLKVEFQDPQFGRRVGFVQSQSVRLTRVEQQPMDLSIKHDEGGGPLTDVSSVPGGSAAPTRQVAENTIFVTPTSDHFEVYLSAAIVKKGVPVTVVTRPEAAALILNASAVDVQQQSTGSKVARCLFAYCAGIEDRGATSVQVLKGDSVVWSYSVNKGRGQKNRQSLAEAVAKHLKDEYFHRD